MPCSDGGNKYGKIKMTKDARLGKPGIFSSLTFLNVVILAVSRHKDELAKV